VTGPPAARPTQSDPGGLQARADGQQVEVRTYEGELIRIVPSSVAANLVQSQLADELRHCIRLKLGFRWLPPRLDRISDRPNLEQMQRRDPGRYAALWRGTRDAHIGKGALGRRTLDRAVRFPSATKDAERP
jgi:hypothetical protein